MDNNKNIDELDKSERLLNVLSITPGDEEPVIYWYNVAQDAIKSAESARSRERDAREKQKRTSDQFDYLTQRLVDKAAEHKAASPLDLSGLITKAQDGDISLSISLYISKGDD